MSRRGGRRIVALTQQEAYDAGEHPGSWNDVRPLLERHLGDLPIPIVVYSIYHPRQAAGEKLSG